MLINEKNTSILQLWDQKLRLSNDRMEVNIFFPPQPSMSSDCSFQAYALSEMANIERLRTVERQITSNVDEIAKDFKDRIQWILSNNQLLPSNSSI